MSDSNQNQQVYDFWKAVETTARSVSSSPVEIMQVKSKTPLVLVTQGIEIGAQFGDNVYINHLLLDENLNLDVSSMDSAQNISPALWQGDNAPTSSVEISGTQKQFLTDFYNWTKAVHQRYIISIGDLLAVQSLSNNTYLILEKLQKIEQ